MSESREQIVVASDRDHERAALRELLQGEYHILEARDGRAALELLEGSRGVRALLLALSLSASREAALLERLAEQGEMEEMPVLLLTDEREEAHLRRCFALGVSDILLRPFSPCITGRRLTDAIALHKGEALRPPAPRVGEATVEDLHLFLSRAPGGVFRYRAAQREELDYVSQGLLDLYGYTEAEFRRVTGNVFGGMVFPADLDRVQAEIQAQIQQGDSDEVTYRIVRRDGSIRWVEDRGRLVVDAAGTQWFYVVVIDITEKIGYTEELKRINERQGLLSSLQNDILFDIECRGNKIHIIGDFERRFGRGPTIDDFALLSRCKRECLLRRDGLMLQIDIPRAFISEQEETEVALPDRDGNPVWCRYQSAVLRDEAGQPYRHIGRLLDAHDLIMREQLYREEAERDALTGVYNRRMAEAEINRRLAEPERAGACVFVILDIDDFKEINDAHGHPVGDQVLCRVAGALRETARGGDVVARIGGDEFIVFFTGVSDADALRLRIERLCQTAFQGFDTGRGVIDVTLSAGATFAQLTGDGFDALYSRADQALYDAKRQGKRTARLG